MYKNKYIEVWKKNNKEKVASIQKKYKQSKKGKVSQHKYKISDKGKIAEKNYSQTLKGKLTRKHAESKYQNSEKGKKWWSKYSAQRRQSHGFNLIIENIIDEKIEHHHINDNDVVAIPRDLHRLYSGRNIINHRFMCNQIIKQIYHMED